MYSKEEKIGRLKSLTRTEMEVVYYAAQGLNDDEICQKLDGITLKALNSRRTGIYKSLGIDVPDKEKQNELHREYVPLMPEVCPDEATLKSWRPTKLAQNQNSSEENQNKPRRRSFGLPVVIAAFFCILLIAVGYGGYTLGGGGKSAVPQPTITNSPIAVQENNSLSPSATDTELVITSLPTETFTMVPTNTQAPTNTIEPTETPKGYLDEGEIVSLKEGIYMYLSDRFTVAGGLCGKPDTGFGVVIVIEDSVSEQFLVRFNSADFHAVDDLGNEYELERIGNDGTGFCSERPGVILENTLNYGYWTGYIAMRFKGLVPLEAKYIYITADWISGVGPVVFRKSIY